MTSLLKKAAGFMDGRGVSLIEILVSIIFLSITLIGFMTTYTQLNRQSTRMAQKRNALRLAQKTLEDCMAMATSQFFGQKSYSLGTVVVDEQRKVTGRLEIETDPNEREIECHVIWTDGNISLATVW